MRIPCLWWAFLSRKSCGNFAEEINEILVAYRLFLKYTHLGETVSKGLRLGEVNHAFSPRKFCVTRHHVYFIFLVFWTISFAFFVGMVAWKALKFCQNAVPKVDGPRLLILWTFVALRKLMNPWIELAIVKCEPITMNLGIPVAFHGYTGIRTLQHDLRVIRRRDRPNKDGDLIEGQKGKWKISAIS